MLDLMPKVSEILEQIGGIDEKINKYKKIEIQFFPPNDLILDFNFENTLEKYLSLFDLKEITIHPPLMNDFDIEAVSSFNQTIIENQLKTCIKLSEKYNIKINLLYHTHLIFSTGKIILVPYLNKYLKIIEGTNVNILLENLFLLSEKKTEFSALNLVKTIDHPNLKMCFDICHAYCQANMFEIPIEQLLENKLVDSECAKYIDQIHFSYTGNNDGYKDKKTHGIGHPSEDDFLKDCKLLEKYDLLSKRIVPEIAEENYFHRKAQYQDIEWFEKLIG